MLKLNIKRNDLVLEVGSGDFPNIYSDVLVDKYPDSNACRNFDLKIDKRPLIAACAEALPFKDKAFDYCISAHAVTYSGDPHKFFKEITRVAHRGLLILPTELHERLYDTPLHRWFINCTDKKLIFRPKQIKESFGRFFHLLYRKDKHFRHFQDTHSALFYIVLEWEGDILFEVQSGNSESFIDFRNESRLSELYEHSHSKIKGLLSVVRNLLPNKFKYLLLKKAIQLSRFPRLRIELEKILACPVCKNAVKKVKEGYLCSSCGHNYPLRNNIPFFLI